MLTLAASVALVLGSNVVFRDPQMVAEPERLAITPVIDGKMEANEWDMFSGMPGSENYFQWEPRKMHAAAKLAQGQDLIVSLDSNNDGWLIGRDNYQFRVSMASGTPAFTARRLDAKDATGPRWMEVPEFQQVVEVAASQDGTGWIVELTVVDPGLGVFPREGGQKVGLRVESFESGSQPEPYLPRAMSICTLGFDRASSVPAGLRWRPQIVGRTVAPGQSIRIRMTFNGENELNLKKLDMATATPLKGDTTVISVPFPKFDNKKRAFVDYVTDIAQDAQAGYRLLRGVITDAQGNATFLKTSYRVAQLVEISLVEPGGLKTSDKSRTVRLAYYVQSNSPNRLEGKVDIATPEGWSLVKGDDKDFLIANPRAAVRRVFEVTIPAGASGVFPITISANLGDRKFQQTGWITIKS